jgi:hypothetical protein
MRFETVIERYIVTCTAGRANGDGRSARFGRQGSGGQTEKVRSKLLEDFRAGERVSINLEYVPCG